ncbi:hypothetical protein [Saccharibacillus sacchari]|uniref:Uncharacterized protein n=1 Tax=Saccharibacillus sacchari TaxID=456493 RepID=A0ACC6PGQ3_9BACL
MDPGTELYRVKGFAPENVVAVRADDQIGGYRLYASENVDGLPSEDFKTILRSEPQTVYLYAYNDIEPVRTVSGDEGAALVRLLTNTVYMPNTVSGAVQDPAYYHVVFDTNEPILYTFWLTDDGTDVMFRNDHKVKNEIREYIVPESESKSKP